MRPFQFVRVKKVSDLVGDLPVYATEGSSGLDVKACIDKEIDIYPMERTLIPTGLAFEIPIGFEFQVRPRSGRALKEGLTVLNTPGTIDSDFRNEVKVILINLGQEKITIKPQERVAQLVLTPIYEVIWLDDSELSETKRNMGGFGSTGK